MSMPHVPVLLKEVLDTLNPRDGGIYVDGTFGAGGYARAILGAAACEVWGIDRDPDVIKRARTMEGEFQGRLHVVEGRFGDMFELLSAEGVSSVDGVALDLGVSSMQIDQGARGFSFQADGPLDMRMEQAGMSAADAVNNLDEAELADIIYEYGEERRSRHVAHAIVEARAIEPITRTRQLAEIVRRVVRKSKDGIDPATRTFQGLRIYVNDELGELERGLQAAEALLGPGGRLAVVSFHSLEDRIVKQFLRERCRLEATGPRHAPPILQEDDRAATFTPLFRGTRRAGEAECRENPRARSAQLRAARRTAAPAWQEARVA